MITWSVGKTETSSRISSNRSSGTDGISSSTHEMDKVTYRHESNQCNIVPNVETKPTKTSVKHSVAIHNDSRTTLRNSPPIVYQNEHADMPSPEEPIYSEIDDVPVTGDPGSYISSLGFAGKYPTRC